MHECYSVTKLSALTLRYDATVLVTDKLGGEFPNVALGGVRGTKLLGRAPRPHPSVLLPHWIGLD